MLLLAPLYEKNPCRAIVIKKKKKKKVEEFITGRGKESIGFGCSVRWGEHGGTPWVAAPLMR